MSVALFCFFNKFESSKEAKFETVPCLRVCVRLQLTRVLHEVVVTRIGPIMVRTQLEYFMILHAYTLKQFKNKYMIIVNSFLYIFI